MENASKALIIAGAILLSILIIGLGMFIYEQAAGAMGNANLDPQKIQAYNDPFEQYGQTQSGTNVRALCSKIKSHNNANIDDPSTQIQLISGDASTITTAPDENTKGLSAADINTLMATIRAGKTYTVTFGYDAKSGLIIAAGFEEKK